MTCWLESQTGRAQLFLQIPHLLEFAYVPQLGENGQGRMRSPKLVSKLTENTLSIQCIPITGSYSDIMSGITKIRPQQAVNFTGCKLQ